MPYSGRMTNSTEKPSPFTKATNVNEIIGTMEGHRAIVFHFTLKDGSRKSVSFDFYGTGAVFNGATYARIESAAISSMIAAGFTADHIKTFAHHVLRNR
ncbi:MAG TPA: hypothetical protein VFP10_12335 [Candidatus Eisenbacteria bacterium]|nr:hypothetical protein [Candidatus Eisenbacteria bacterium]